MDFKAKAEVKVYRIDDTDESSNETIYRPYNTNGTKSILSHYLDDWNRYDFEEKTPDSIEFDISGELYLDQLDHHTVSMLF